MLWNVYAREKCPGFDRPEQTMPDTMHTVTVQVKHLCRCLAGKAPEDSLAVRNQEMELNRFPEHEEFSPSQESAGISQCDVCDGT